MAIHFLHHGGAAVKNIGSHQYPSAEVTPNDGLAQAAHKEHVAFGNTRLLDFSSLDGRRQAGLQQYLDTHTIAVGDEIVLCAIPKNSFLIGLATEVEFEEEGVAFTVQTKYSGIEFDPLSLAKVDSNGKMLDEAKWLKQSDYITLKVTAWPSTRPQKGRFSVTPLLFVPKLGN